MPFWKKNPSAEPLFDLEPASTYTVGVPTLCVCPIAGCPYCCIVPAFWEKNWGDPDENLYCPTHKEALVDVRSFMANYTPVVKDLLSDESTTPPEDLLAQIIRLDPASEKTFRQVWAFLMAYVRGAEKWHHIFKAWRYNAPGGNPTEDEKNERIWTFTRVPYNRNMAHEGQNRYEVYAEEDAAILTQHQEFCALIERHLPPGFKWTNVMYHFHEITEWNPAYWNYIMPATARIPDLSTTVRQILYTWLQPIIGTIGWKLQQMIVHKKIPEDLCEQKEILDDYCVAQTVALCFDYTMRAFHWMDPQGFLKTDKIPIPLQRPPEMGVKPAKGHLPMRMDPAILLTYYTKFKEAGLTGEKVVQPSDDFVANIEKIASSYMAKKTSRPKIPLSMSHPDLLINGPLPQPVPPTVTQDEMKVFVTKKDSNNPMANIGPLRAYLWREQGGFVGQSKIIKNNFERFARISNEAFKQGVLQEVFDRGENTNKSTGANAFIPTSGDRVIFARSKEECKIIRELTRLKDAHLIKDWFYEKIRIDYIVDSKWLEFTYDTIKKFPFEMKKITPELMEKRLQEAVNEEQKILSPKINTKQITLQGGPVVENKTFTTNATPDFCIRTLEDEFIPLDGLGYRFESDSFYPFKNDYDTGLLAKLGIPFIYLATNKTKTGYIKNQEYFRYINRSPFFTYSQFEDMVDSLIEQSQHSIYPIPFTQFVQLYIRYRIQNFAQIEDEFLFSNQKMKSVQNQTNLLAFVDSNNGEIDDNLENNGDNTDESNSTEGTKEKDLSGIFFPLSELWTEILNKNPRFPMAQLERNFTATLPGGKSVYDLSNRIRFTIYSHDSQIITCVRPPNTDPPQWTSNNLQINPEFITRCIIKQNYSDSFDSFIKTVYNDVLNETGQNTTIKTLDNRLRQIVFSALDAKPRVIAHTMVRYARKLYNEIDVSHPDDVFDPKLVSELITEWCHLNPLSIYEERKSLIDDQTTNFVKYELLLGIIRDTPNKIISNIELAKKANINPEISKRTIQVFGQDKDLRKEVFNGHRTYFMLNTVSNDQWQSFIKNLLPIDEVSKNMKVEISKEAMTEFVNGGLTTYEIQEELECSRPTVTRLLQMYGLKTQYQQYREKTNEIMTANKSRIMNWIFNEKKHSIEVSLLLKKEFKFTVHPSSIDKYIQKWSEIKRPGKKIEVPKEKLEELVTQGLTVGQIGNELKCSTPIIANLLQGYGLMTESQKKYAGIGSEEYDEEELEEIGWKPRTIKNQNILSSHEEDIFKWTNGGKRNQKSEGKKTFKEIAAELGLDRHVFGDYMVKLRQKWISEKRIETEPVYPEFNIFDYEDEIYNWLDRGIKTQEEISAEFEDEFGISFRTYNTKYAELREKWIHEGRNPPRMSKKYDQLSKSSGQKLEDDMMKDLQLCNFPVITFNSTDFPREKSAKVYEGAKHQIIDLNNRGLSEISIARLLTAFYKTEFSRSMINKFLTEVKNTNSNQEDEILSILDTIGFPPLILDEKIGRNKSIEMIMNVARNQIMDLQKNWSHESIAKALTKYYSFEISESAVFRHIKLWNSTLNISPNEETEVKFE